MTSPRPLPKVRTLSATPAQLGYSFPAEWAPHLGTLFSWPRPEGISFPAKYHTVPENLTRIFIEVAKREQVHINVPNENYQHIVKQQLAEHGFPESLARQLHFHFIRTNEAWCRDHGPAFVLNSKGKAAIVDWAFNAWGGKYPPYDDDDAVPTHIAKFFKLPVIYPGIVMEGGSIDVSGAGCLLTTTDCLLNKNRNPHLTRVQIEQYLKDYYGQQKILWLTGGIEGDDTDGHIDDLARFLSPRKIAFAVEPDPKDVNYRTLQRVRKQLASLTDTHGEPFEIVELPMPAPVTHDGQRLPATYLNFHFVNNALLVPTYRDRKNDRKALSILQDHLPNHEVIGIDCTELIWGLGAIHCLSQQIPRFR